MIGSQLDSQYQDRVVEDPKLVCWDFDKTISSATMHMHNLLMTTFNELETGVCGQRLQAQCIRKHGIYTKAMGLKYFRNTILEHYKDELLKPENIRNLNLLAEKILSIHEKGHHQAITSFTWFPSIGKATIRFILEEHFKSSKAGDASLEEQEQSLVDTIVDNFLVVGGFPLGGQFDKPEVGAGSPMSPHAKFQHMRVALEHFGIDKRENVILIDDSQPNCQKAQSDGFKAIYANPWLDPSAYLAELEPFLYTPEEKADRDMLSQGLAGGIPRSLVFGDSDSEYEYDETDDEASEVRPAVIFSGYPQTKEPENMSLPPRVVNNPQTDARDALLAGHCALERTYSNGNQRLTLVDSR